MTESSEGVYKHKYRFLLVTALSAFIGTLDGSIVNVSLPTLARDFAVPVDTVAWVVLSYSLTIAATLLLVGRLAVKRGFRFTYLMGFGLFTIGSGLCAMSGTIWHLVAARGLQGVGASFMMAAGPALVTRSFPPNERGKGMGILGTIVGVGLMSGPPLGGLIVSTIGWHWIFLLNIPVGIFGYLYAFRTLRLFKPDEPNSKIDYQGGVTQALAVVLILLFLNRINHPDWHQSFLYGLLVVGLAALAAFLYREVRAREPLVGLSIFRHTQFTIAISVMLINFISTAAGMILIPFYLEEILFLEPSQVGLVLVTVPICAIIVSPLAGRVSDIIGYRLLTTLGLAMMAGGVFWIATLDADSSRFDVVMRLILLGVGGGMFHSPNSSAMMSAVPRSSMAIASSLLAVSRTLGLAGGVAVSTAVFAYRRNLYLDSLGETQAFVQAFSWVITAFGCLYLAAVVLSAIRKNRLTDQETPVTAGGLSSGSPDL